MDIVLFCGSSTFTMSAYFFWGKMVYTARVGYNAHSWYQG